MKSPAAVPVHQISLRLREVGPLFDSMDPTPFRHRDLDPNAEEFIESWAQEFPSGSRFLLVIHPEQKPDEEDPGALGGGPYLEILREGLIIAGWVAMWRPIQIFLYDWWPIARRRRMLQNLSRAQVRVVEGA